MRDQIRIAKQGRRVEKRVLNAAGVRTLRERYVYVGYTCVQVLNGDDGNAVVKEFAWDPTEPVATRPLMFRYEPNGVTLFYAFDGNKNVSDVFCWAVQNGVPAHYDYAPFGAITRTSKNTPFSLDFIALNPWRFSSEFYDSELDLVYYNYRHYSPALGRWLNRDPIEEQGGRNLYAFCRNECLFYTDSCGTNTITATMSDNLLTTIIDFLNGGGANTWVFTYPHPVATRLLSHPQVSALWNTYTTDIALFCVAFPGKAKTWKGSYTYTATIQDFWRDVSYLLGLEGLSADGAKEGDISVNMLGSFKVSYKISIDCCKKQKQFHMEIVDHWSIESLTRNPFNRQPIISTPILSPIELRFIYDVSDHI